MRSLEEIVSDARRAEDMGIFPKGTADRIATGRHMVGHVTLQEAAELHAPSTVYLEGGTQAHQAIEGSGLRGHSVSPVYPFGCVAGRTDPETGLTEWTVKNMQTGALYETYDTPGACIKAHGRAEFRAKLFHSGQVQPAVINTRINEEF